MSEPSKIDQLKAKAKTLRATLREIERVTRGGTAGDRHRDRMAERSREQTATVADIGELPATANAERKGSCKFSLMRFLQLYFPSSTGLSPFSTDHERVIARVQACILEGGRFINAVYRGFAKTTISTNAAIWAALYGHRRSIVIFSCNDPQASDLIESIKMELSENDLLYDDFPEVCHAVRALQGKPQRCSGQTYQGKRTHIKWRSDRIVMPEIPGFKSGGCLITSRGITGSGTRGLVYKTSSGINQRPDFVIIDDPQTNESAATGQQVTKRLDTIKRSILKLAGHNRPMACVVNATVIAPDDLVEQLLDPKRNPAWQGERIKMVRKWADAHETLWLDKYAEIRNTFDRDNPEDQRRAHQDATDFYQANRDAMDTGCQVSWSHCYSIDTEISAIQHAYNLFIDDGADVFATECQNEPIIHNEDAQQFLTAPQIQAKVNGYARGEFPTAVTTLTAFFDVGQYACWWAVCGWEPNFSGYVLDYGAWPDQQRAYYSSRDLRRTLADLYPGRGLEAMIFAGLTDMTKHVLGRVWTRDDGAVIPIAKALVDSGDFTDTVYSFTRQCEYRGIMLPSKGRGIKAGNVPFSDFKAKPGDRVGKDWVIHPLVNNRAIRLAEYDTNQWKTTIQLRLATALGDPGSLSLYKATPYDHRMIAEHLTAEKPVRTAGRGRELWEWTLPPSKPDNHIGDCVVGCGVAASIEGIKLAEVRADPKKPKLRLSELYAMKRGRR